MKDAQGFTLIELLVVISVVAILAGLVVPGFTSFIRDNRMTSQINTLVGAIHFARGEAANRRSIVTLCASSDQATCNTTNWEAGWIIFTDSNNNGDAVINGSDELLLVQEALDGNTTLRSSGFNFGGAGKFHYAATGFMMAADPQAGTFTLCDEQGASDARAIIVNISGVSRLATDENNDGIVNDHTGNLGNVSCP
ncbi:GspH/FimT family pseudopilin [Motiliproteus sediminis]|uniref:GspH/FimT family pseudopilin n=1 Tax=Motiliproteus sediminis TaxID=1468178 RepID=UPI001AEF4BE6|nr:GspH/FimT family pseudopilin [Motiliproteus sediminis]